MFALMAQFNGGNRMYCKLVLAPYGTLNDHNVSSAVTLPLKIVEEGAFPIRK